LAKQFPKRRFLEINFSKSIFCSFWDKLDRKRPKSANFQNLKVFIFHPILMQFLWSFHHNRPLKLKLLFFFSSKRDLKAAQLIFFLHIWKVYRMFLSP
jgi:hypothetical protein